MLLQLHKERDVAKARTILKWCLGSGVLMGLCFQSAWAATGNDWQAKFLAKTKVRQLQDLGRRLAGQHQADESRIREFLLRTNEPRKREFSYQRLGRDGKPENFFTTIELAGFDENQQPLYNTTHNLNAARTVAADQVWPGGSLGLALMGAGITIGEWDEGSPLLTHQELNGRITVGDGASHKTHSTHVAGTLLALGMNANAHGMAAGAQVHAYDWNADVVEMAQEAANGLLLSNHSYGYNCGWQYTSDTPPWRWYGDISVSQVEDYKFGFYNTASQSYDLIANNAPYYLIVKSAGNDRNDNGPGPGGEHRIQVLGFWVTSTTTRNPDGVYDCLEPRAVAKNVLTVGAVQAIPGGYTQPGDVVMSWFSSYGPADDGRIKPDIVADGVSVYSCSDASDTAYTTMSGTSMSTPNTTGSLALLQQHYQNLHAGASLLSSEMKALVIHTADEAGAAPGPDYAFGWGLLDVRRAAQLISADAAQPGYLQVLDLSNGGNVTMTLYATGSEPLKATLAWNDPAGTPAPRQVDPRKHMLVNDLDLRMYRNSDGQAFYPWVLDVEHPDQPATTGDNSTDNVEQVVVNAPASQEAYTLVITHKGSLSGGAQELAVVISGGSSHAPATPTPTETPTATAETPTTSPTPTLTPLPTWSRTCTPDRTAVEGATATITQTSTAFATRTATPTASLTTSPPLPLGSGKTIMAYPNPAKSQVAFLLAVAEPTEVSIRLYNVLGERVASVQGVSRPAGQQILVWDCREAAPGMYLAQVLANGKPLGIVKLFVIK